MQMQATATIDGKDDTEDDDTEDGIDDDTEDGKDDNQS
jgi:hypothetical protein